MTGKKGLAGILVAVVCAAALCFVLGACSGSGASNQPTFSGKWVMCELTQDGTTLTYDKADDEMKGHMDDTWFEFNADGSVTISDMGYTEKGTLKKTSDTEATVTADDLTFTLTIKGDRMSVTTADPDTVVVLRPAS